MERRVIVRGRARARARVPADRIRGRGSAVDADEPFVALLDAWLDPAMPAARWAVVVGDG